MYEQIQYITISFNIPNNILESIANIICKPSKRMHIRKYNDVVLLKFMIIFNLVQPNSNRELYRKIKANQITFDEKLPSITNNKLSNEENRQREIIKINEKTNRKYCGYK